MTWKMPREQKQEVVRSVQAFFESERDERIGDLAAEQLVDLMISELGAFLYNQGIADARKMAMEKMSQLEDELFVLEKPLRR